MNQETNQKTIVTSNESLRSARQTRDRLLREIERMPERRQGTEWHTDRVDALTATRRSIQDLEILLGGNAEPEQRAIGTFSLIPGSEAKYLVVDASKEEGVLFITARRKDTGLRGEFSLLQKAPHSLDFCCVIGSASTATGSIAMGQELTLSHAVIMPCEVRAFEHTAWENVGQAVGYAVVVGDHAQTAAVGLARNEAQAWQDAQATEGTERLDLENLGYRAIPVTEQQYQAIHDGDLNAASPDVSGYQPPLPSYLRAEPAEQNTPPALGL